MHPWYEDAIFYHIYPLGAVNTKRENDHVTSPQGMERLMDWIPHMVRLGCNAVYLGPIFESSTHGYDTADYLKIDSRLGTNQQFTAFVGQCHAQGIRVVVDGVFNHTGREFFAFQDLKKHREGSSHRDWYRNVDFGGNNPLNDGFSYEAWRNHWELPRLNPFHPPVVKYLLDTALAWIREFDIDGIRLDCADCLEPDFMKQLRTACLSARPDFWLMGEIIHGDYNRWANRDTLHSVTNYEAGKGLHSSHNDGNMHEIAYTLNRQFGSGGIYKDLYLYNFADNHDVNRLADTVKQTAHLPTVYTILFAMPGIPSLYYGSEWGLGGVTDRATDWNLRPFIDIKNTHFDNPDLLDHILRLARLRSQCASLRHGSYQQIHVAPRQLAFLRQCPEERTLTLVNCAGEPADIPLRESGTWYDLLHPGAKFTGSGTVMVTMPPYSSKILREAPLDQSSADASASEPGRSKVKVRLKTSGR